MITNDDVVNIKYYDFICNLLAHFSSAIVTILTHAKIYQYLEVLPFIGPSFDICLLLNDSSIESIANGVWARVKFSI